MYEHYCHTSISEGFSIGTGAEKKLSKVRKLQKLQILQNCKRLPKISPGPEAL